MVTLNLRLPDDIHAALKEMAKADNRSLNSEIIHAILEYKEQSDRSKRIIKYDQDFADMRQGNYTEG